MVFYFGECMTDKLFPILRGKTLFRENELVFINKSTELQEYCNILHKHDFIQHKNLVDKALDYLKQNYNSDIKLDDLAIKSFVSKNYFSKLFKEVAGINFSDYIQKLRVDEACSLLKNTDFKISDIANQVGIKDMKSFYEVFKKITGETPGDYRKK